MFNSRRRPRTIEDVISNPDITGNARWLYCYITCRGTMAMPRRDKAMIRWRKLLQVIEVTTTERTLLEHFRELESHGLVEIRPDRITVFLERDVLRKRRGRG
jgi:hypothetical protein